MHRAHSVKLDADAQSSTPVIVPDITSQDLTPNAQQVAEITGSRTRPSHSAVTEIKPVFNFSSFALEALFDVLGVAGLPVDSDTDSGVTMFLAAIDDYGDTVAGSNHQSYLMKKGIVAPRRLTVDHRGEAQLECTGYAIQKATNDPIVVSATAALPTITVTSKRWTLGPIDLAGTVLTDYTGIDVDFGLQIDPIGVQSDVYDKYIGVKNQTPSVTIRGISPGWFGSSIIPLGGKVVTHANSNFFLRKRTQDGDHFVANGTAEHIKLTYAGITAVGDAVRVEATRVNETTVRVAAIEDTSGNSPLIVTTASAIS